MAGPTAYGTIPLSGEEILKQVEQHREQLQALGARTIGLFGSYRRGTPHAASDLDFLVTLERPSFRDYMAIKFFLEALFGRQVDLVLEESLKPRLRARILSEVAYASGLSPLSR
jgi:predicted nucleotidyltransferase